MNEEVMEAAADAHGEVRCTKLEVQSLK